MFRRLDIKYCIGLIGLSHGASTPVSTEAASLIAKQLMTDGQPHQLKQTN